MALRRGIPEDAIEIVNDEQIGFNDLDYEAEFEEENKYYTISGKEQNYLPGAEKYSIRDFEVSDEIEGDVEIVHYSNVDKKYDSLRIRLIDEGEIVDCYVNIPKPDDLGYITNIRKNFDFYRTCFDFIYSILKWRDERNVVDKNGEEVNVFKKVNIRNFAKYVDQHTRVGIRITEGNPESEYNSFVIYKME